MENKYVYLANLKTNEVIKVRNNNQLRLEDENELSLNDFIKYDEKGVNQSDWFYTSKEIYVRYQSSLTNPNVVAPKFIQITKQGDKMLPTVCYCTSATMVFNRRIRRSYKQKSSNNKAGKFRYQIVEDKEYLDSFDRVCVPELAVKVNVIGTKTIKHKI